MAGLRTLTVTSPVQSFDEPITLAEALDYLRLPLVEEGANEDSGAQRDIQIFISAARAIAEAFQSRDLVAKQWDLVLDCFPCRVDLGGPIASVDLVQYTDSDGTTRALVADTDYIVDLTRGYVQPPHSGSWPSFTPWPFSAVLVRYTTQPSAVSEYVKVGMLQLIGEFFTQRLPATADKNVIPPRLRMLLSMGGRNPIA